MSHTRFHRVLYVLFLWSTLGGCIWAQTSHPGRTPMLPFRVDHLGVNDGLTQGSVYYMLKDSRSFLWFGTQDGLNRYDGHQFRTYRPAVGERGMPLAGAIRGVNIVGIVEDPGGNLWIGTEEGLNRYDRQHDRFDFFSAEEPITHKRQFSRTLPFFINKTELLYLSDVEGLVRFDYRNHRKKILHPHIYPPKEYDLPSSTARTATGDIWLHAPNGLVRYNIHDKTLYHYFSDQPNNQAGSPQTVFSFFIEADTIAWIGTGTGLTRFDYRRKTIETYDVLGMGPVSAVYSIAADQRGRLWLGTQRNGVLYFDKRSRLFGQVRDFTDDTRRLSDFEIRKVFVDDMGIVWANVDPDGLVRIIPDAFLLGGFSKRQLATNLPDDQRLSNYTIRGFMEERFDRLWITTEGGINVLDPQTNRVVRRYLTGPLGNLPAHKLVRSVYRDPKRRIWVGIRGGVLAFHPENESFEPFLFVSSAPQVTDNYVRNLTSINDSTLIAATEDGLYALNTIRRSWLKLPYLAGQNIFSLWYDAKNRQFWVGTFLNGYYCYQLPDDPAKRWQLRLLGLKGSMVLHFRPDTAQRTVWMSTDRGLAALKPATGKLKLYTEQQGLANSFVYGSLTDAQGNIWMSTNRGISRIDHNTGVIKNFTLSDGLQGSEFNGNAFIRLANGELFFGGVNGFNRFRPDLYHSSFFSPKVHIYSLNINEEPVRLTRYIGEMDNIDLAYNQNTLSMEFAALDYYSNGHNTFQYQLTNYDAQWVSAGEKNYVRYANLPPGDYVFQVKAANRDGHWSSRIRKLAIHIQPPFWQTKTFSLLVALLLGLFTFGWVRRREDRIRRREAERLQLAYDIQEQVKKDIARDLHDEIGTRLATLKLYTTRLVQYVNETSADSARSALATNVLGQEDVKALKENIYTLINSTIHDVRNLLRKLNPQTLERYGYVAAVEELFSRINATGTIAMNLTLANAPGEPELDEQLATSEKTPLRAVVTRLPVNMEVMLYRITQELVSNSLKHANASRIDLYIEGKTDRLLLTYADDGQGFDYEKMRQKPSGLGISNVESRVAILNGKISWQAQTGQGVRALIDIPTQPVVKRRLYHALSRFV